MLGFQLIALDVDGTLLDSRGDISPANRAALAAARGGGAQVVLATGRRRRFAAPIAAQLGLDCWLIASNGALTCPWRPGAPEAPPVATRLLPAARAAGVLAALRDQAALAVVTFPREGPEEMVMADLYAAETGLSGRERADRNFADPRRAAFGGWLASNREAVSFIPNLEDCLAAPGSRRILDPVQIMYCGAPAQVAAVADELAAAPVAAAISCSRTVYPARQLAIFDVLAAGVSKGAALAELAARLGVAQAAVVAMGDNYNDLEMLEFAGQAVLMGNAHAELARPGWLWTADHDHDGVAAALRDLGLAP